MITAIRKRLEQREEGFTLIELLVVVIIIGILAAIAIPAFLSQRDSARASAVDATLRSAGTYMEVVYTNTGSYPTADAAGLTTLNGQGFRAGATTLTVAISGAGGYCLQAAHNATPTVFRNIDTRSTGTGAPVAGACA